MLQALIAYADRRERESPGFLDQDFQPKPIDWLIQVSPTAVLSGQPVQMEGRLMRCPSRPEDELNQGDAANFLVDQLCRSVRFPESKHPEKADGRAVQHGAFKQFLRDASAACPSETEALKAVLGMLENEAELQKLHVWLREGKAAPNDIACFSVGSPLVDSVSLQHFWRDLRVNQRGSDEKRRLICVATGVLSDIALTTDKIRGLPGGNAKLIAFDKPAFGSFGLEKGENAAVSVEAELKFRSALNDLIERGLPLGEVAHLHWTREPVSEDPLALLDAPDEKAVERLIMAPKTGQLPSSISPNAYYAMSLCSVKGRIMVRDWLESTVSEIQDHVGAWFRDLTIIDPDGERMRTAFKLWALLASLVPQPKGKPDYDSLPPQLSTQLLYSALRATALSQTVLVSAVRRQQVEARKPKEKHDPRLNPARLALIKACLIRSPNRKEHHTMTDRLDLESRDTAYLCGQLFAVIGRLQLLALGKIGASIADRTYGGVATRPATTLGPIFTKVPAYLKKANVRFPGSGTNKQKELERLCSRIDGTGGIPRTLDLESQGRFALGYYCQLAQYRTDRAEADAAEKAEQLIDEQTV